ncbi:MFS transporter [Kitasatospora sp. NPDC001175]|uniref:MFS transporter n=1 Tax=Kitasatospora sp. NPDC001175 TaxID=3157103 RepID=UPI003D091086
MSITRTSPGRRAASTARGPGGRWWALAALTISILVVALDSNVLVTALPTLSLKLDASTSQLQWITVGYTLASAGLLLPAGKLGDRFGRRATLLIGLLLFGASSITASQVTTAGELIATRVLMGAGGAMIMPMALAVLPVLFPEPAERGRAVAVTAIGTMLGLPLGPLLAGWLLNHFAWGSIFLINGPVVVLGLIGVVLWVPESKDPSASRVDWSGALLSAAGVTALVYGMIEQPIRGWDAPVQGGLIGGGALLACFLVRQLRADSPLINLSLFASRGFTWGSAAFAVTSFALSGAQFVLTPYLQVVQGSDAQGTGLRLLPLIAAMLVGAALGEKVLAPRLGPRVLIPLGMLVSAAGLGVLTRAPAGGGYGLAALALIVFGFGLGLVLPLSVDTVLASLPAEQSGVGNAMSRTLQGIGVVFGSAVLGSVLNGGYRAQLTGTLRTLPDTATSPARSGVAGAHDAARHLSATDGRQLIHAADHAYVHGMTQAASLTAGLLAVCALLVVALLPGRRRDHRDPLAPSVTPTGG